MKLPQSVQCIRGVDVALQVARADRGVDLDRLWGGHLARCGDQQDLDVSEVGRLAPRKWAAKLGRKVCRLARFPLPYISKAARRVEDSGEIRAPRLTCEHTGTWVAVGVV